MFQFRNVNDSVFEQRGHFSVALYNPKYPVNYGILLRTAALYGATNIIVIGSKFEQQRADTMKSHLHIQVWQFEDFDTLKKSLYPNTEIVAVEMTEKAKFLHEFHHPERACYLLGNESLGIPEHILNQIRYHVKLPGKASLNVGVAGSIVIYDRFIRRNINP